MDPDRAWEMRMDVALMMLAGRARLVKRAEKESPEPQSRTRGDGKREVRITSLKQLASAAKQLRGNK